jgi:hypothetical protein
MPDYIFLMHSDTVTDENYADWEIYIERLGRELINIVVEV